MTRQIPDVEPDVDQELKAWGQRLQQETIPSHLQALAAQLQEMLLQRRLNGRNRLDG